MGRELGRSLLKKHKFRPFSGKHSCDTERTLVNPASITEQNDIENFLAVSVLADRDFSAVHGEDAIRLVTGANDIPASDPILPDPLSSYLSIPRRPNYHNLTGTELVHAEQQNFLQWRQHLAQLEALHNKTSSGTEMPSSLILTPFERNLEIWRQLWRVLEPCGLIVQVVDARNPLLFYCPDIERYGEELEQRNADIPGATVLKRRHLILLNKADLLSKDQRQVWNQWLTKNNLTHAFFSALESSLGNDDDDDDDDSPSSSRNNVDDGDSSPNNQTTSSPPSSSTSPPFLIQRRKEILNLLRMSSPNGKVAFVGYPNVGKSSTINALCGVKRVAVASTPGKTKHYQTLLLPNGLALYDCPGLVFPNFATSKGELILSGVLPIDHMRDWREPVRLLLRRIPSQLLGQFYGLLSTESISNHPDNSTIQWTEEEFVSLVAQSRGFNTSFHGSPDLPRAARIILKDYFQGILPYVHPPPELVSQGNSFNTSTFAEIQRRAASRKVQIGLVKAMEQERREHEEQLISQSIGYQIKRPGGKKWNSVLAVDTTNSSHLKAKT